MFDRERLKEQLEDDEGFRKKLYRCTAGKLSIGIGRNIEDKGISRAAALFMLDEDIDEVVTQADQYFPWWRKMTPRRQEAFLNFLFNVGIGTALTFVNTIRCLKAEDYQGAAEGFKNSLWFRQVGQRAQRIVDAIREG